MAGYGCIPTYCAAVWRADHIVVLELEVLVEHGRVQLYFAVELVADLFPVGGWLRHGYRGIMARWRWSVVDGGLERCNILNLRSFGLACALALLA